MADVILTSNERLVELRDRMREADSSTPCH
jgi:hypothetical protein